MKSFSLNSDGQQFHQYQQMNNNFSSPTTREKHNHT